MLIVITGPTASGKTFLAEETAREANGEIISADSRTLYRNLMIGTGGYSNSDNITYHLTGIIDIGETFSAHEWVRRARKISDDVINRGKLPIICGGTLHYIEMFLKGMDKMPEPDEDLRTYLKTLAKEKGRSHVHDILKDLDPPLSEKVHPNNLDRIVRYIERAKGNELIEAIPPYGGDHVVYFMLPEKKYLEKMIRKRVIEMFELGWIDEVQELKRLGISPCSPGLDSIGYGDVFSYINENISFMEAIENIINDTMEYSKKQCKWMKRMDPKIIKIEKIEDLYRSAEEILEFIDTYCRSRRYVS